MLLLIEQLLPTRRPPSAPWPQTATSPFRGRPDVLPDRRSVYTYSTRRTHHILIISNHYFYARDTMRPGRRTRPDTRNGCPARKI